jgi:LmeA-like phospholipid-binding
VSEYQPRSRDGWPAQPPADGAGQGGYGQADYAPGPGSYDQATYGQQAGRSPVRRRRRKRWPIVLTVIVVLILAILGIGDQIAKSVAQNDIATQIQSSGLSAKPSVNIEGWPFLTQVAAHDVKTIDISANNVTASGSKVAFDFTAKATGVHLNSSFNGATVDNINGQAVLPFSSVATLLPVSGVTLSPDPAKGPNAVTADLGIAGSVTGTVQLSGSSKIVVALNGATGLASILGSASGQSYTIDIPQLPAGLVVRSVRVNSQGIVATASATHTTLSQ